MRGLRSGHGVADVLDDGDRGVGAGGLLSLTDAGVVLGAGDSILKMFKSCSMYL